MDDLDIFIIVALFGDGVGHEEKEIPFHEADGLPALFATFYSILLAQGEGISERRAAVSKLTLCFFRLLSAFAAFHVKRIGMPKT